MPLVSVDNVSFSRNRRPLLAGINFRLHRGEFVMVGGDNGAGKSTLLKIICGLLAADKGGVRRNVDPADIHYIGHQNALKNTLTPRENLSHTAALRRQSGDIAAAIDAFGLAAVQDRPCRTLSAGQLRLTALARLAAFPAKLWILDEPLANVDDSHRLQMGEQLRRHLRGGGGAIVANHHQSWPVPPTVAMHLPCLS